jgi:hypothetical protein
MLNRLTCILSEALPMMIVSYRSSQMIWEIVVKKQGYLLLEELSLFSRRILFADTKSVYLFVQQKKIYIL